MRGGVIPFLGPSLAFLEHFCALVCWCSVLASITAPSSSTSASFSAFLRANFAWTSTRSPTDLMPTSCADSLKVSSILCQSSASTHQSYSWQKGRAQSTSTNNNFHPDPSTAPAAPLEINSPRPFLKCAFGLGLLFCFCFECA